MTFQLSFVTHCRGTAEDTVGTLSLILLLASPRAVPVALHLPSAQGHTLHHLHPSMVRTRNACSQLLHFTPQALQSRVHTMRLPLLPAGKLCSLESNSLHQISPKDAAGVMEPLED